MTLDQFPQMVYKAGGPEEIHGGQFSTLIVGDAGALEAALADGWHETTVLAAAPVDPDEGAPTRAELEQKAGELGIKVDGRWSDKRLSAEIDAKLSA